MPPTTSQGKLETLLLLLVGRGTPTAPSPHHCLSLPQGVEILCSGAKGQLRESQGNGRGLEGCRQGAPEEVR